MFGGQVPPGMSHWALRRTASPHRRPRSLAPSPPLRVHGAGALWCPTPRRHPRLASGQETAVIWVIIIEIWYNEALPLSRSRTMPITVYPTLLSGHRLLRYSARSGVAESSSWSGADSRDVSSTVSPICGTRIAPTSSDCAGRRLSSNGPSMAPLIGRPAS